MIPVEIRPYRDGDFPGVHQLEMAGGHEAYRSAVFVRQMAILFPATFLVANHDDETAGYIVGAQVHDQSREAWILRIGVRTDLRRNGIGSAILEALLELLRNRQCTSVRLTVSPRNVAAAALYAKAGFRQEHLYPAYFGPGEDRIQMIREM